MYLCGDVGGTKTLLAVFTNDGELKRSVRFPTNKDYKKFLSDTAEHLKELKEDDFKAAAVAFPGVLNRKDGIGISMGNLPWKKVELQADLEKILKCPVVIENDAKTGGLAEAKIISDFKRVLYITIGTGIGVGLTIDGVISHSISDSGGHDFMVEHNDRIKSWESFASGTAIVREFGKEARDIKDVATWKKIARNIATGLRALIAITEPDAVVVGGGVGVHFDRFGKLLEQELKKYEMPMVKSPTIRQAKNPDQAVLQGAYLLVKERYGHID